MNKPQELNYVITATTYTGVDNASAYNGTGGDPICELCEGSGNMYICDGVDGECPCVYDTTELDEIYNTAAEVNVAIEKLQMLNKLAGKEIEYEWEVISDTI